MRVVVRGTGLYGRVDHVGTLFHVATRFWHLYYVPIIPLSSWLITAESGDEYSGRRLPLQGRSVLHAYVRSWGGLAALLAALLSAWGTAWPVANQIVGPEKAGGELGLLVGVALNVGPALLVLLGMTPRGRIALAALLAWAGATAGLSAVAARQTGVWELHPISWLIVLVCVGLIFLVRRWEHASTSRALRLAAQVGIPPEVIVASFPASPDSGEQAAPRRKGIFGGVSTRKLIERAKSSDAAARLEAAEQLAGRPEHTASEALIGLLWDTETRVRLAARQGLIQHGPAAVEALVAALKHHDTHIAAAAAEILGEVNDGRAAAPLAQALVDAPRPVQLAAIRALADMGRPAADAVRLLAEHENPWVRRNAQELLVKLGG